MCGRAYQTYTDEELYFQYLNKRPLVPLSFSPIYNLCPTQDALVLCHAHGERRFEHMRWQLVPATEPAFTTKLSTINARSETVFESSLYRDSVVRQRCIVPLSGFYEWKKDGKTKRPFKIHLQNNLIMSVAGIWETWRAGTSSERRSFSILTTAANAFMRNIHDRMPVILAASDEDTWLDPAVYNRGDLQKLLKACPDEWLAAVEISTLVNSPKNNTPDIWQLPAAVGRLRRRLFDD
jgi:putative SOS response-associated peptidase YedK